MSWRVPVGYWQEAEIGDFRREMLVDTKTEDD